jgi:hypothetical protein
MTRLIARILISFALLAGLALVGTVIWSLTRPLPLPPPMPKPNGYDDFVKAGGMLEGDMGDWANLSREELQGLVRTNSEALKLARIGLSRECRVPLEYSPTSEAHLQDLSKVKRLAQALGVEAKLAEVENRTEDAASTYLEMIRLGEAASRGGVVIDGMVGVAIEAMAPVERLITKLDAKQCREFASISETTAAQQESAQTVLDHEEDWARRTYGLRGRLMRLMMSKSLKPNLQRVTGKMQAQQARIGMLAINLAARAYEVEKGQPPKTVADLVPAYLKAVPKDPVTGRNMAYPPGVGSQ